VRDAFVFADGRCGLVPSFGRPGGDVRGDFRQIGIDPERHALHGQHHGARFVNGDPSNDHRDQGGKHRTFDIPVPCPDKVDGNIGYLGGDFKGVLNNADYIRKLGFGAVWITPIVDNPDEAFTGSKPISCTSTLTDRGKTGYHGYWGVNFYKLDEHLPSADLDFAGLTKGLHDAQLKVVLDIVGNHGSPAWTMPVKQPQFGQIFDKDGTLIADRTCRRSSWTRSTTRCTRSTTTSVRWMPTRAPSSTATWPSWATSTRTIRR